MLPEAVEKRLRQIILDTNPEVYVVDIALHRSKRSILTVLVDTDKGIVLPEITAINRAISRYLDEEDPLEFAFNLEVSSPGIGKPLKIDRQYVRHIGRDLKVKLKDGSLVKGRLVSAEANGIVLQTDSKAKAAKKPVAAEGEIFKRSIPFSDILETIVTISFN